METTAITQGRAVRVPLRSIVRGDNPRKEFDPAAMSELVESIKAQGLLQKPLLRPAPNDTAKFEIVAGERRIRAYTIVYGEDAEIEVDVKELTDEQARAAAVTENVVRRDMTPLEEAEAAAKTLGDCHGDRGEAARFLGWTLDTLNKRLGLMNAAPEVRDALRERKIKLGHAELLATMRKEAQVSTLDLLLKKEPLISVSDLKHLLDKSALVLDNAIFDKKDCAGCQHNSSNQNVLFAEAIAGGKCTNKACFESKTEEELQARAKALQGEYQVVRIARAGENFTVTPLVVDGPKGVGEEQAKACKTCQNYGAVVSAVPDKLGNVYKGMCMDLPCNVLKVAAHNKPADPPAPAASANTEKLDGATTSTTSTSSVAKPKASTTPAPAKAASSEPAQRVKEYRETLWRAIFKKAILKLDVPKNRAVLVALCLTRPSVISHMELSTYAKSHVTVPFGSAGPGSMIKRILELEAKALGELVQAIPAHVDSMLTLKDVVDILKVFDVKVSEYWKVSKPFLELLTKNEIDAVAEEIGLKKHMGADYPKARNGGKAEFIDALMASKFDFVDRIPKLMDFHSVKL